MNFIVMLAALTIAQSPSDVKALDFHLVGTKKAMVTMAPPPPKAEKAPPRAEKARPPVVKVPVPVYTRTVKETVQAVPTPVQQEWFQNPDGSSYRVIRRYVPSNTFSYSVGASIPSYSVGASYGVSFGASGASCSSGSCGISSSGFRQ